MVQLTGLPVRASMLLVMVARNCRCTCRVHRTVYTRSVYSPRVCLSMAGWTAGCGSVVMGYCGMASQAEISSNITELSLCSDMQAKSGHGVTVPCHKGQKACNRLQMPVNSRAHSCSVPHASLQADNLVQSRWATNCGLSRLQTQEVCRLHRASHKQ